MVFRFVNVDFPAAIRLFFVKNKQLSSNVV